MNKKWFRIISKKEKPHVVDDDEAFTAHCAFRGFHSNFDFIEYLKKSKYYKTLPLSKKWADLTKPEKEACKEAFNIEFNKFFGADGVAAKKEAFRVSVYREGKRLEFLAKQKKIDEEKRKQIAEDIEKKLYTKACSKCLKKYKEGVNFCGDCGGKVILTNYCNKCKAKRQTNYCYVCGERIIIV